MLFANDYNDKRIHIDDTHSNKEYYCPYCGAPLITKKGDIRQHHFAHRQNYLCSDSWERNHSYDISPWHYEWQALFPKNNQEIRLSLGDTKHRADVMIDRTVIEFQHSIMSVKAFDDRNNFYFNLGYKVIWLFDLSDLFQNNQLLFEKNDNGLVFYWRNPKRAFNNYDIKSGCIDLFFQLSDNEGNCIVRVTDVSYSGFERFYTTQFIGKNEFLNYVGMKNGICLPPCRDDIENNQQYQAFKEKYQIYLNKQQERALQTVEGSNLLLAVPGSGKTTVLVARLGHMVINKNIPPENILAITYNNIAANEMKARFFAKFGKDIGKRISFRTINSLSYKVYLEYCHKYNKIPKEIIKDKEKRDLIRAIYKMYTGEDALENDILEFCSAITYIKNMMLSEEQVLEIESEYPHLNEMYKSYQDSLKNKKMMDFDDQMVFAHWIFTHKPDVLEEWRSRYKYICVDEAQDISKIQYEIIHMLAQGNNIFMVGDEDQSIYGFRAACPQVLLNFRYDYLNPYILRMERNYRSTMQIVDKAQSFISQNKGRYDKNMTSERGNGEDVRLDVVQSRIDQYMSLLNIAKAADTETAFLYRDNESAVVLVDLLLRNKISFKLRKPEMNFFGNHIVKDIVAYLSLALDENDTNSLEQICNKGILYLAKQQREFAIRNCRYKHISVYDAIDEQMKYVKPSYRNTANNFRAVMGKISKANSSDAISILKNEGYVNYVKEQHLDICKIEILLILSKQEPEIKKFLFRLKELENLMSQGFNTNAESHIILSTIHSSKGLEYDRVYMVDVYDGRFPSSRQNIFCRSKDSADVEQEERRLFYVGITRAKNFLQLFSISNNPSTFIDELFPEQKIIRLKNEEEQQRKLLENREQMRTENLRMCAEQERIQQENYRQRQELLKKEREEDIKKECELQKRIDEIDYINRYNEVKDKFVQQGTQIRDSSGNRWIQCEICGAIKEDIEFKSYGGNKKNLGMCYDCYNSKSTKV